MVGTLLFIFNYSLGKNSSYVAITDVTKEDDDQYDYICLKKDQPVNIVFFRGQCNGKTGKVAAQSIRPLFEQKGK